MAGAAATPSPWLGHGVWMAAWLRPPSPLPSPTRRLCRASAPLPKMGGQRRRGSAPHPCLRPRHPTISSLAFLLYTNKFLQDLNVTKPKFDIPVINYNEYNFLRKGYSGGSVDVYKPYADNKVFGYDVNSLYPFVMKHFPMPIGNPTYFEGNIIELKPNAFGIFKVKVTSPEGGSATHIPILQTRINNSTVSPAGTWTDVSFSKEIYIAALPEGGINMDINLILLKDIYLKRGIFSMIMLIPFIK